MGILLTEDVAGNYQQVLVDRFSNEFCTSSPWSLGEKVESTAGCFEFKVVFQAVDEPISFLTVVGAVVSNVDI